MPQTKGQTTMAQFRSSHLAEMGWNDIDTPGCYLLVESGELVRIPQEALAPGHSPLVTITSTKDMRVARISENPAEAISTLRSIAADNDYYVNF